MQTRLWAWSHAEDESEAEQIFIQTYPAIYQHLVSHRDRLTIRDNRGEFYWELRSCTYYDAFEKPKIIYPDISSSMRACYDTTNAFCLQTNYVLPTDDFSLSCHSK